MLEHKRLVAITSLSNTATSVYSNPASTRTYVKVIYLHNTGTTDLEVTLWSVASGGSAQDANQFFKRTLPAGSSYQIEFGGSGLILESSGEKIYAMAGTASKVNLWAAGATSYSAG